MLGTTSDRNLLFGILAMQLNFVTREELIAGASAWIMDKQLLLDQILLDQGALSPEQRNLLEPLVEQHVKAHGNDIENSLASVSSVDSSIRDELKKLGDADIEASLVHVRHRRPVDPDATQNVSLTDSSFRGERFRILRPHAKGGLGQVSVAIDQELHREVALKEIQPHHADSPERQARFVQEAEITGGLEHPGIVPIYGLGQYADGRPFYAMRFIRGDSLKQAIERFHQPDRDYGLDTGERSLEFPKLLGRFIDVCNAVDYAHSRGVLHRDLKPGNVMLGKYGETLLVDWGLAKTVQHDDNANQSDEPALQLSAGSGSSPTQMGSAIGTPAYMSPEQAEGRLDLVGATSDVYSLGATLYCLLTGQPPFVEQDPAVVLRRVRDSDYPSPRKIRSSIPMAMEAICIKAMAAQQSDRYATPGALAADLEKWLADEPVTAYQERVFQRLSRWMRRHKTLVVSTASTVLVVTAALGAATALLAAKNTELTLATNRADRNFRQAQATVDEFFTDVSEEQLLNEPGMQPLRGRLLQRALEHYETFLRERADDPSVLAELARANHRIGEIQWDIGSNADAIHAYEQSLALTERLLEEHKADTTLLSQQAANLDAIGVLRQRMGEVPEARILLERALEIKKELASANPDDVEIQRELARGYRVLGNLQLKVGGERRPELLQESVRILESLTKKHSDLSTYARIHSQLADAYSAIAVSTSDDAKSIELYDRLISIQRNLATTFPRVLAHQQELGSKLQLLASRYRDVDPEKAAEVFRESIEIQEVLANRNPDVKEFQADLGWSCDQLGFVLHQQRELDEAMKLFERARDIHVKLVEAEPDELLYQQRLATIYNGLALTQRDRDQFDESYAAFQGAVQMQEKLIKKSPEMIELKEDLAGTHNNISRLYQHFERWDEALESQQRALQMREIQIKDFPNHLEPRRWAGESWMSIALIESMRGNPDESQQAYESAVQSFQGLVNDDRNDQVFQSRLLAARVGQTIALIQNGAYEPATDKTEQLVADHPAVGLEYNAACVFSLASQAALDDENRPETTRSELSEKYALRAIELLTEFSRIGGFNNPQMKQTIKSDPDLDAIRARSEFKKLISKL